MCVVLQADVFTSYVLNHAQVDHQWSNIDSARLSHGLQLKRVLTLTTRVRCVVLLLRQLAFGTVFISAFAHHQRNPGTFHSAILPEFKPSQPFQYRFGDSSLDLWSEVHELKSPPPANSPISMVAYGDLGEAAYLM